MKKIIFALVVFLLPVLAMADINPRSIVGHWASKDVNLDTGTKEMKMAIAFDYNFKADNSVDVKVAQTLTLCDLVEHIFIDNYMYFTASGTYSVAGDSITIVYNFETLDFSFPEDEIRVRGVNDPDTESAIKSNIVQGIAQNVAMIKEEMMKEDTEVLNNVIVTDKKMTFTTTDGTMVAMSKKKK